MNVRKNSGGEYAGVGVGSTADCRIQSAAAPVRTTLSRDDTHRNSTIVGWSELALIYHHVSIELEAFIVLSVDHEVDLGHPIPQ